MATVYTAYLYTNSISPDSILSALHGTCFHLLKWKDVFLYLTNICRFLFWNSLKLVSVDQLQHSFNKTYCTVYECNKYNSV